MKKLLASALACLLLCQGAASAAGGDAGQAWSRPEGDGSYVTIRVPGEPGMALIDTFDLAVRYADTGEPVALSSAYLDGYLFATVPAENADRPLGASIGIPLSVIWRMARVIFHFPPRHWSM